MADYLICANPTKTLGYFIHNRPIANCDYGAIIYIN